MDRRQSEQHAAQKLARAALPGPRKRCPSRVSAALWARALALWAMCRPRGPLSPGAYKYPLGSSV